MKKNEMYFYGYLGKDKNDRFECSDLAAEIELCRRICLAKQVGCLPNELYALGYPETTDAEILKARKEALDTEVAEKEVNEE